MSRHSTMNILFGSPTEKDSVDVVWVLIPPATVDTSSAFM